ncbi:hypothetical protein F5Y17DRAFT_475524 [Xylariaceae sp. FL0594]|nr:hypothetical protein F5Y17DRAFT_475524 [Xylariaceae sp. FL0594]
MEDIHSFDSPSHYFNCQACFQTRQVRLSLESLSISDVQRQDQNAPVRPINISVARLSGTPFPGFRSLHETAVAPRAPHERRVYIQLPDGSRPVRPDQTPPPSPVVALRTKRPASSIDESEPAYLLTPAARESPAPVADVHEPWKSPGIALPSTIRVVRNLPLAPRYQAPPTISATTSEEERPTPSWSRGFATTCVMQVVGFFSGLASGLQTRLTSGIQKIWRPQPHPDLTDSTHTSPLPVGEHVDSPAPKRPRHAPVVWSEDSYTSRTLRANGSPQRFRRGEGIIRASPPRTRQVPFLPPSPTSPLPSPVSPLPSPVSPFQSPTSPIPSSTPLPQSAGEEDGVDTSRGRTFAYHYESDLEDDGDMPMTDAPAVDGATDPDCAKPLTLTKPGVNLALPQVASQNHVDQQAQVGSGVVQPIALNQPGAILAHNPRPNHVTSSESAVRTPTSQVIEDDSQEPAEAQSSPEDHQFFPKEFKYSLPGIEKSRLTLDARKEEQIKRDLRERIRAEQDRKRAERLQSLGLRRPKATLITEASQEWVDRAVRAPSDGHFDGSVHPAAVKLQPRDFAKLVPETAWLNDDCVHSTLCCLSTYVNEKAGVRFRADAPKCVAMASLNWTNFCSDNSKLYPRLFQRQWGMNPHNFFNVDTVLIPVNSGNHWTLLVLRPSRRSISYMDSYNGASQRHIENARKWLQLFLEEKYVADEWREEYVPAPRQHNAWDCGMFVITNAMCLALGIDPLCYDESKMPVQRRRIAAMLLQGGFSGEFDLGNL